jgi:hypothetical protein
MHLISWIQPRGSETQRHPSLSYGVQYVRISPISASHSFIYDRSSLIMEYPHFSIGTYPATSYEPSPPSEIFTPPPYFQSLYQTDFPPTLKWSSRTGLSHKHIQINNNTVEASETRGTTALVYLQLHSSLYTGTVHVLSSVAGVHPTGLTADQGCRQVSTILILTNI